MYAMNTNMMGYNPIGNVLNMNTGYNNMQPFNPLGQQMNGYFNGMYNSMYNPYLMKQQMQRQQALQQEQMRQQADIWKNMIKAANQYTGTYSEQQLNEKLKMYDPGVVQQSEEVRDYMNTSRLLQINANNTQTNSQSYQHTILQNQINFINNTIAETQQKYAEMNLADFMNTAMGDILYDAKMQEYKRKKAQLGNMYNSATYNQLLQQSNGNTSYFNSIYDNNKPFQSNIDISDMEITLPNSIQQEMEARKARFLQSFANI